MFEHLYDNICRVIDRRERNRFALDSFIYVRNTPCFHMYLGAWLHARGLDMDRSVFGWHVTFAIAHSCHLQYSPDVCLDLSRH